MKNPYIFLFFIFFSLPAFSQINQPYGLFFIQDNQVKDGHKIFEVPTLKTDVDVKVQGLLSTTTVRQYFINPTKEHTEAIYLFPLPDKYAKNIRASLFYDIGNVFNTGEVVFFDKLGDPVEYNTTFGDHK